MEGLLIEKKTSKQPEASENVGSIKPAAGKNCQPHTNRSINKQYHKKGNSIEGLENGLKDNKKLHLYHLL